MKKPYIEINGSRIALAYIMHYNGRDILFSNIQFGDKIFLFGELIRWNQFWIFVSPMNQTKVFIAKKGANGIKGLLKQGFMVLEMVGNEEISNSETAIFCADLTQYNVQKTLEGKVISALSVEVHNSLVKRVNTIIQGIKVFWGDVLNEMISPSVFFLNRMGDLRGFEQHNCEGISFRDKYSLVCYSEKSALPEIHELTHLYLYQLGKPSFLFLEGMPTLMEQLIPDCSWKITPLDTVACNAFVMNRKLRVREMLNKNYSSSENAKKSGAYFIAASFLKWCMKLYGWEKLKKCYVECARNKSNLSENDIFCSVFGITIFEAEKEWRNTLKR